MSSSASSRASWTLLMIGTLIVVVGCDDDDGSQLPATDGGMDALAVDGADDATAVEDAPPPVDAALDDSVAPDGGPRPIVLPDDERPHDDPVEWWYYTGLLETKDGQRYGFEMVTFQAMMVGYPTYIAHFGVTDPVEQRFSLATRNNSGAQAQPASGFRLEAGSWSISGQAGAHQIVASMSEKDIGDGPVYAIDLALDATKPVVYQYGKGWMTIGSDDPFYYYSYTNMAATGTLTVDGVALEVSGRVWMDHQWGNMGSGYDGWRWFSIRLDDGSEVMLFYVDRNNPFAGGTMIEADGSFTELKQADFVTKATGEWTSPHTGATYPQGWTVSIPARDLQLSVAPVMEDQEFHKTSFEPVYWEGLCDVTGSSGGKPVTGHAYVELTGYAGGGGHP